MSPKSEDDLLLFELPPPEVLEKRLARLKHPIWTENKSRLIERYLYFFVLITHHGTYIDGFAGPQNLEVPDGWTAKRVVESRPRWLRHLYLFDVDPDQADRLRVMRDEQSPKEPKEPARGVHVFRGDFNRQVAELLRNHPIKESEAAFCLLDQRTFECDWETVRTLANHKRGGRKIELFYFLPNGWLERAVAALGNRDGAMLRWWGTSDWQRLLDAKNIRRAEIACERFKSELGYTYVIPFPIFERERGGKTMFYMIHASDHPDATKQMFRAYNQALEPLPTPEQMELLTPCRGEDMTVAA